jgi:hypothetical protein
LFGFLGAHEANKGIVFGIYAFCSTTNSLPDQRTYPIIACVSQKRAKFPKLISMRTQCPAHEQVFAERSIILEAVVNQALPVEHCRKLSDCNKTLLSIAAFTA